ncbi:hypothetical protein DL96DRAFT_1585229 [Flagelloscypha sp. PMI_526]|nr:hypothetical protein DL96DRAFT_1585229 [Flagelloscypha sp. PMI_526]
MDKPETFETPDLSKLEITSSPNPWDSSEPSSSTEVESPKPAVIAINSNDTEEELARTAWANTEAHPPVPPKSPSPPPPTLPEKEEVEVKEEKPPPTPTKDEHLTAPNILSTSGFPSLANLARSFSIPSLTRSRPTSMDGKAVPSPTTLASASGPEAGPSSHPMERNPSSSDALEASNQTQEAPTFDFQKFLEQMNLRSAEPVSKYLKSFLSNFSKRTFTVNDQIKIINDFLNFIAARMRECDPWRKASDAEFDNAIEGMEKLVMNRLYDFTFTPQLLRTNPPRPVTTDDLERDRVLAQRIALFGWIEERHLDVPEGEGSKGFLAFAQQELLKLNHYKAPRDKVICILNSCKVIFGLIRHLKLDEGADAFLPVLIFVVLKANPDHLLSNVEFINRFRNPEKLQSEAGYYLSSLMGAVSFIETMDHTSLSNITQEEFERNVELAIQALPPIPDSPFVSSASPSSISTPSTPTRRESPQQPPRTPHAGEESAQPLALPSPSPGQVFGEEAKRIFQKTGDTISRPISALGKIFSDALDGAEQKLTYLPGPFAPFELGRENRQDQPPSEKQSQWQQYPGATGVGGGSGGMSSSATYPQTPHGQAPFSPPIQTPYKPRVRKTPSNASSRTGSPASSLYDHSIETPTRLPPFSQSHPHLGVGLGRPGGGTASAHISRTPTPSLDLEAVQAEINMATEHARAAAYETLKQMFPATEDEVIHWVLEANDNDLGRSIDQLLEMS